MYPDLFDRFEYGPQQLGGVVRFRKETDIILLNLSPEWISTRLTYGKASYSLRSLAGMIQNVALRIPPSDLALYAVVKECLDFLDCFPNLKKVYYCLFSRDLPWQKMRWCAAPGSRWCESATIHDTAKLIPVNSRSVFCWASSEMVARRILPRCVTESGQFLEEMARNKDWKLLPMVGFDGKEEIQTYDYIIREKELSRSKKVTNEDTSDESEGKDDEWDEMMPLIATY